MKQIETKSCSKVAPRFSCENCDYFTDKKSSFDKHLLSTKHKNETNMKQKSLIKQPEVAIKSPTLICDCGITCKSRTTLWRHKKQCVYEEEDKEEDKDTDSELTDKEIIKELLQQTEKLMKIMENGVNNNSHNTNTTNNNKTFNLNFFLNETCKDAMNITDFVSSIKVNLEDLENTGRQGYVQGITNIVLKNLNNLEQHLRPLHCSDLKREVMYIKDNNEWTKETEENPILTKAIKTIANENIKQIKNWKDKHNDCTDSDSKSNNLFLKIVSNSMNGFTKEEGDKNINKIISNVAKDVLIDKT
jgi:hypothetical protein